MRPEGFSPSICGCSILYLLAWCLRNLNLDCFSLFAMMSILLLRRSAARILFSFTRTPSKLSDMDDAAAFEAAVIALSGLRALGSESLDDCSEDSIDSFNDRINMELSITTVE